MREIKSHTHIYYIYLKLNKWALYLRHWSWVSTCCSSTVTVGFLLMNFSIYLSRSGRLKGSHSVKQFSTLILNFLRMVTFCLYCISWVSKTYLPYSSNKELIIMKHVSVNFVAIKFKSISMLLHRVVPGKGNKWSAFHVKPEDMIIMIMKVHVIMNLIVLFMHKLISL